jgi:hypothetical protein
MTTARIALPQSPSDPPNRVASCSEPAAGIVAPILARMQGVKEYLPSRAETEDSDRFEHTKVLAFLDMLDLVSAPGGGARLGLPFPLGFDDAKDLESWPLIQVARVLWTVS